MPIDFPTSPTTGQVYTYLGKSWVYNGTGWDAPRALSEIGAVQTFANATARTAAIPSPTEGIVSYLNDVDRLDVHNGTAHVPAAGLTHILTQTIGTAVSSVVVANVFSANYNRYKVFINSATTTIDALRMQFNNSTGATYSSLGFYMQVGSTTLTGEQQSSNTSGIIGVQQSGKFSVVAEITDPFLSVQTQVLSGSNGSNFFAQRCFNDTSTVSSTGFILSTGSGTMTGGIISVYGYRKD
jgi:hypothetical protein